MSVLAKICLLNEGYVSFIANTGMLNTVQIGIFEQVKNLVVLVIGKPLKVDTFNQYLSVYLR
jgi:hypothetical protein